MAARLDLFAVDVDDEDTLRLEGFVSASDDDEQSLFELLTDISSRTPLAVQAHGSGRVPNDVVRVVLTELQEIVDEHAHDSSALIQQWARKILETAASVQARGAALAWQMRYDVGGSLDDGPDEFPTSWSGDERPSE